jgi:hypothetical protein
VQTDDFVERILDLRSECVRRCVFRPPSSDDSYWESNDDKIEDILLLVVVQNLHDEENRETKRRGSTVSRLCIPHNQAMGSEMLMRDYFAEVTTYPEHLFVDGIK